MSTHLQTFFSGQWRDGSGTLYSTEYPATGEVVAQLHASTAQDVDEAVRFAEAARHQPDWAKLMPHQRAAILHKMAALIREKSEELAALQRLDNGKPVKECRALVASAAGTFQYFAAVCETFESSVTPQRGDFLTMSLYQPLGVVGAITPWNSPIASEAQKIAPALAAGCAVVIKPAEITPRMAIEFARIGEQAGLPQGILSVLPGKGSVVGDALVKHPLIKRIAFTGGTNVGLGIAELAAKKLMPVSLELGGKSPTIVCADADLDHAVAGVIYGIFSSSGESCVAGSRAFVHASVYEEFKRRLLAQTAKLRVADPALESTHMGPLISKSHRESVERYVALALEEGGKLLCGGKRPAGDAGYYYEPTIFEGLPNTSRTAQEEIFGPVLCLLPWESEEDLIAQANDNDYGLACGIWSQDYKTALRLGSAITAGTVWVNTYKLFSISTPFTGYKMSGLGREKGAASIMEYMMQKSFYWGTNAQPLPWSQS
ncbi:aldehyde dehydrogenase [Variovorax sp. PCZ-1]|uniref:aldehyde dehydrogenase n=1 Tax=Variovorax sp. PCZ-1 TaxID=2835533 RepID=UPI001BCD7B7D|nr:aldehyde dehydrogenase [Variovorax sp. PCZ-1]MBS7808807.1 aldehyde dehydrogenase [Variovorax sp. PCZ-1]